MGHRGRLRGSRQSAFDAWLRGVRDEAHRRFPARRPGLHTPDLPDCPLRTMASWRLGFETWRRSSRCLRLGSPCKWGETLLRIAEPCGIARRECETRHVRPHRDRLGPGGGEGRREGGVLRQKGRARRAGSELWRSRGEQRSPHQGDARDRAVRVRVLQARPPRFEPGLRRHADHRPVHAPRSPGPRSVDRGQPRAEPKLLEAGVILIATGSTPRRPSMIPFAGPGEYDSDTIQHMERLPRSLAIAGGGTVGCEYACLFKVRVIHSGDRVLPFADHEISTTLREGMESLGVEFHMSDRVEEVDATPALALQLRSGKRLEPEALLVALGRRSNVAALKLENV